MYARRIQTWLTLGALAAVGCTGSTRTTNETAPGALPKARDQAAAPRLNATTYFAHAHLLERQGQFDQAVAQYHRALALAPDFLTARCRLGITLNKAGRHAEASQEFRHAIAQNPRLAHLHNNLGFSLYLEGQYAEAQAALRHAVELKPEFARARTNHAVVLAKLGRFDEAFGEFCLAGTEADAYYNIAMFQTESGRYADAATALEAALRLNPQLHAARQQLQEVARLAALAPPRPEPTAGTAQDADMPVAIAANARHESSGQPTALPVSPALVEAAVEEDGLTQVAAAADTTAEPPAAAPPPSDHHVLNTVPRDADPALTDHRRDWSDADLDQLTLPELLDLLIDAIVRGFEDWEDIWCEVELYLMPETVSAAPPL